MKKFFIPLAAMAVLLASSLVLNAQTGVDNYVSASGFVLLHAPSYYTGNDGYCYDFENDYDEGRLLAWTTIDADAPSLDDLGTISNNSDWVNNWQNYGAILLPANVGKRRNGTTYYTGNAYYWCCNHRSEETNKAYDFLLWNSLSDIDFIIDSSRKYGYCVRLILKED